MSEGQQMYVNLTQLDQNDLPRILPKECKIIVQYDILGCLASVPYFTCPLTHTEKKKESQWPILKIGSLFSFIIMFGAP